MEYKISEGEQEWREEPVQVGLGKAVPDALPNPSSLSTISVSQRLEGRVGMQDTPCGMMSRDCRPWKLGWKHQQGEATSIRGQGRLPEGGDSPP